MAEGYADHKKRKGVCDSFCDGCVFKGYANATLYVCEYFFQTGIQRPCPAGTGCTVKETGKKKKRWQHESDRTWKNKQKRELLHKVCVRCGQPFDTTNPKKMYCSNRCKNNAQQSASHKRKTADKEKKVIVCVICGKQFTSTDGRRKCCSTECTQTARKLSYFRYIQKRDHKEETG